MEYNLQSPLEPQQLPRLSRHRRLLIPLEGLIYLTLTKEMHLFTIKKFSGMVPKEKEK